MSKELKLFEFEGKKVRVIEIADEPWFVAMDVCSVLGYADPADAVKRHCKSSKLLRAGETPGLEINPRGQSIIPESDLYRLIMRSNLAEAERFQDWVVEEVLPSIRKTGGYVAGEEKIYSDSSIHPSSPCLSRYSRAILMMSSFRVMLSFAAWTLSHFSTG